MFCYVKDLLQLVISELWKTKFLSVETDDASSMTGRVQGAVKRSDESTLH